MAVPAATSANAPAKATVVETTPTAGVVTPAVEGKTLAGELAPASSEAQKAVEGTRAIKETSTGDKAPSAGFALAGSQASSMAPPEPEPPSGPIASFWEGLLGGPKAVVGLVTGGGNAGDSPNVARAGSASAEAAPAAWSSLAAPSTAAVPRATGPEKPLSRPLESSPVISQNGHEHDEEEDEEDVDEGHEEGAEDDDEKDEGGDEQEDDAALEMTQEELEAQAATTIAAHQRGKEARRQAPGLVMKHPPKGSGEKATKPKKGKKKKKKKKRATGPTQTAQGVVDTFWRQEREETMTERVKAATKIEAAERGRRARRKKKQKKPKEDKAKPKTQREVEEEAATKIEAAARGRLVRTGSKAVAWPKSYLGRVLGAVATSSGQVQPKAGAPGARRAQPAKQPRPAAPAMAMAAAALGAAPAKGRVSSEDTVSLKALAPSHAPSAAAGARQAAYQPSGQEPNSLRHPHTIGGPMPDNSSSDSFRSSRSSSIMEPSMATRMAKRRQERAEQRSARNGGSPSRDGSVNFGTAWVVGQGGRAKAPSNHLSAVLEN